MLGSTRQSADGAAAQERRAAGRRRLGLRLGGRERDQRGGRARAQPQRDQNEG
jgi:hypothetical protein